MAVDSLRSVAGLLTEDSKLKPKPRACSRPQERKVAVDSLRSVAGLLTEGFKG